MDEKLREEGQSFYIKNFTYHFFNSQTHLQHFLKAEEAFLPANGLELSNEHVIVYDFSLFQYTKTKRRIFLLRAQRGELDKVKQRLFLKGKILYEDREKKEIRAEEMEYDFATQVLSSTGPVQLKQSALSSICKKGITINLRTKRQDCRAPQIRSY